MVMCVITKVAINSVIVYLTKKPLSGLDYFAGAFLALGVFDAGLAAGVVLGLAGALGFLAGADATAGAGSGADSVGRGNGQLVPGASTL
jgi:hypothetical protein